MEGGGGRRTIPISFSSSIFVHGPFADPWSFVLPLNPRDEYEGGGTQFVSLEGTPTFRPDAGHAVMFAGRNRHCGRDTTAGVRYILAGFCGEEVIDGP